VCGQCRPANKGGQSARRAFSIKEVAGRAADGKHRHVRQVRQHGVLARLDVADQRK